MLRWVVVAGRSPARWTGERGPGAGHPGGRMSAGSAAQILSSGGI